MITVAIGFPLSVNASEGDTPRFKSTHLELHHRFDGIGVYSVYGKQSAVLLTVQHYSDQSYGDWFLFFDALGNPSGVGSRLKTSEIYYHIEPRFSVPRIFSYKKAESDCFIQDYYWVFRFNDADVSYIKRAVSTGWSVDLNYSKQWTHSLTAYLRKADRNKFAPMLSTVWGMNFSFAGQSFNFNGFIDFYKNDLNWVLDSQPQLVWSLQTLGLSSVGLGTEQQLTRNSYGPNSDWTWMPTIFAKLVF